MEMLVICKNCGEVERYDLDYFKSKEKMFKNNHKCSICANSIKEYKNIKKDFNRITKLGYKVEDLCINNDISNFYGRHKGFKFEKVVIK